MSRLTNLSYGVIASGPHIYLLDTLLMLAKLWDVVVTATLGLSVWWRSRLYHQTNLRRRVCEPCAFVQHNQALHVQITKMLYDQLMHPFGSLNRWSDDFIRYASSPIHFDLKAVYLSCLADG